VGSRPSPALAAEARALRDLLAGVYPGAPFDLETEAVLLLSDEKSPARASGYPAALLTAVEAARSRLDAAGVDWRTAAIEARYARVGPVADAVTRVTSEQRETRSDRLDRVVTHKVWGMLIFFGLMALMFQSIFTLAELPMNILERGVQSLASWTADLLGPGRCAALLPRASSRA